MYVFVWEYGPIPNTAGRLALIVSSGANRMYGLRRGHCNAHVQILQYSY